MTKQLCRDCKHLETDGMFGIFCGVGGDNTKYDCPKYAKRSDRMTEKRWYILCYCDDEIEAEDKDEAYKIFCKKHNFKEEDAEFVSYYEVEE